MTTRVEVASRSGAARAVADGPSTAVDVSVVIVTWNSAAEIQGCLESLAAERGELNQEILVVDNASVDGTREVVVRVAPAARLLVNAANRGFAAANNQGFAEARGRYILCLNPDTRIEDRAVERMVSYADAHPDGGLFGCQVWKNDVEIQRTCFSFPGPWALLTIAMGLHRLAPNSRLLGKAELGGWNRDTDREVDVVTGMFMLVRREAFAAVGPMDEDYFVYGEEADWCHRFWQAGWPCMFTPTARIVHLDGGGKSTRQVRVRMFVQQQKSLLIFNRKNLGPAAYWLARSIFIGSMAVRSVFWGARVLVSRTPAARNKWRRASAALRFHLFGTFLAETREVDAE